MVGENKLVIPIFLKLEELSEGAVEALGKLADKLKGIFSASIIEALKEASEKAEGELGKKLGPGAKPGEGPTSGGEGGTGGGGSSGGGSGGEGGTDGEGGGGESKPSTNKLKEKLSSPEGRMEIATKAIRTSANLINTGLKKGFSIVEDIYGRLRSASPLLQAIESMFNLAMQLFFMPLGNKLAEVMIPSVLELVDEVVKIWNSFEGKSLGEMFDFAINTAVKLFGGFFEDIGEKLIDQGGMIGKVGVLIQSIGNFITDSGASLLTSILGVATSLVKNFKHFVSIWMGLKTAEVAMQGAGLLGQTGLNAAIAVAAISATAALATEAGLGVMGFSEGGYVPAKPGGQLAVVSEGGEGEYIVPESKLQSFVESHGGNRLTTKNGAGVETPTLGNRGGSSVNGESRIGSTGNNQAINVNYYISGYTDSELKTIIRETMDEQVAKASYRG